MVEIWKDIKGYEGLYQASNLGNIRTYPNKTTFTEKHGVRRWKCRVMKGRGNYKMGKRVCLWKDGKCKDFLVARLVAFTFYDKDINDHDLTVNHLNGNRLDNNISNLELVTLADNIRHAFNTGLMTHSKAIEITELKTGIKKQFLSLAKASKYIGKNRRYISCQTKRGKFNNNDYCWIFI